MTNVEAMRERFEKFVLTVNPTADLAWLDELPASELADYLIRCDYLLEFVGRDSGGDT